jgi:uncharacterized protein YijF (DUF1287 family)
VEESGESILRALMLRCTAASLLVALLFFPPACQAQSGVPENFVEILISAALERTGHRVIYDGSYRSLDYPGGDVPDNVGVCTDVVIRSYRTAGVDLQKDVHEDMSTAFSYYPDHWGMTGPDRNIDHRRVYNLQAFFSRRGKKLAVTDDPDDYLPGDLVTWVIPGNLPHIGIVVDRRSRDGERPLVVHNIGQGPKLEDMLFSFPVTGHFRYHGRSDGAD